MLLQQSRSATAAPIDGKRNGRRVRLVAILTLGGALAVAGGAFAVTNSKSAVHRQGNGVLLVEGDKLLVNYQDREISQVELAALMKEGKAMFQATDVPSANSGYMHAFDTQAALDAYSERLVTQMREKARQ